MSKNAKSEKSEKMGAKMRKKNRKIAKFRNADFDRYLLKQRQSNRDFGKTEQKVGLRKNAKKVKNMRSGKPEFFSFCDF